MNVVQAWVEARLSYPVAWDDTAAWAQAFGAVVAIVVTYVFATGEVRDRRSRGVAEIAATARRQYILVHSARILIDDASAALQALAVPPAFGGSRQDAVNHVRSAAEALNAFPLYTLEHRRCAEMVHIIQGAVSRAIQASSLPLTPMRQAVYDASVREAQRAQSEVFSIVMAPPFNDQE